MNRAEFLQKLATEPATPRQLGAVMHEFERLGYRRSTVDRPARLGVAAALLHLEQLGSTHDLTMGEAGRLLHMLQGFRSGSRADLETWLFYRPHGRADPVPLAVRGNLATLFAWSRLYNSGGAAASRP